MATITVSNLNDNGNGSLRQAIANANPGDTIDFAANLAGGTLTLTSGELDIASNVTIEGDINHDGTPDITISGGGNSRVFHVGNVSTADLDGLVITNGNAGGDFGGGLLVDNGANATVTDSTLSDNYAFSGGAIANLQSTLTLADTTLSGNTGGQGGGIYGHYGSITAINTTVSGNLAAGPGGGIASHGADVSLIDSTVSGNAASSGGGLFFTSNAALTFNNSIVAGNSAGAGADAYIFGLAANVTLQGHSILGSAIHGYDESINTTNGSYTTIDGTSAAALGTVFARVGNAPLTNVLSGVLAANGGGVGTIALNPTGIAIDAGSNAALPTDTLDLNHNGNTTEPLPVDARGDARVVGSSVDIGAFEQQAPQTFVVTTLNDELDSTNPNATIADMGGPNDLSLREALFLANEDPTTADTITFAPSLSGGTLTLSLGELVIASNVTIEGDIDGNGTPDITVDGNNASRVLSAQAGSATLDGLVITGGSAVSGGGLYVNGGASMDVTNSDITGNSATYGGGLYVARSGFATVTDSALSANSARYGGAIGSSFGNLTLANTTLSGNEAGGTGGAIDANYTTLTAINTTVSGNGAVYDGGGIVGAFSQISLISSTVSGNAGENGGGVFILYGSLTLTNSIMAGNNATTLGNDVYANKGQLFAQGNNIIGSAPRGATFDTTNGSYMGIDGTSAAALGTVFAQVGPDPNTGVQSGLLGNNGGLVETIALKQIGIAVDTGVSGALPQDTLDLNHNGNTTELLPVDARGLARVVGASVDIGAFEAQATPANLVVTTLDDETYDGGDIVAETADGNGLSLREALGLANAAGGSHTITFDPTLSGGTVKLTNGELFITSDVTIDGDIDGNGTPGIAVDGNYTSRVFSAQAGHSTLDGLDIVYGSADRGGGLRIYGGASVDVTNSTIAHNTASNYGGGIYVGGSGTLELNGSQVGRNTAADGGGIGIGLGQATITNSNIYLNFGSSEGGGIFAYTAGTVALTNAAVAENSTYGSGGGIYVADNGALTLTNATLTGNYSAAEGGAIFADQAGVTLTNSTLTGNYALSGGGLYADQADVTVGNSIAAGNAASSAAAGYDVSSASSGGASNLHFSGHNILGSTPTDFASVDTSNGNYTQIDGTSPTDLGKVFAQVGHDPNTHVLSGVLGNNGGPVATVALNPTGIAVDTGVTADAVYDADNNPATPDVPIPTDARGFSRDVGSSVDVGAFEQQAPQNFVVTTLNDELDSTSPNATIADMGGPNDLSLREALFLANEDPTTADTITFANNLSGGTIDLTLGQLEITGGVTIDGDINGTNTPGITIDAQGSSRAIDALYGTSTIDGLTLTGGYGGIGGAVKVGGSYGPGSADLTISNSTITNNQAVYGGGIAVNYGSSLQLTNTVVSGNNAYLVGGGIANQGTLTLTNSTVTGNSSGYIGGGIASDNSLTIIGSTLSDNQTGVLGPGLPPGYHYGGGGGLYNSGSARLLDTTISGNKGGYGGGGIYNSEALTLINVTLANNSADYGGGLSNAACGCGDVSIYDTTVTGNIASVLGGGISNAGGLLTLANSIVAGNSSAPQGPDISNYATITYSGVNLFSQSGIGRPGTDIYVSPSDLANVFANPTTIDPDGVPNSGDEFLAGTLANNGGPVETVLIKLNGAADNAGDNTALPLDPNNPDQLLPTDARGETRVFDGTVDLGAVELQALATPVVTASNINASPSENFTPAQLFSASMPLGDPIVSYEVEDENTGSTNGFWVLDGAVLPNGQITTLSAAQLSGLIFVAGSDDIPVPDTLEVAASNAGGLGAFTTFTVTASAHLPSAPPVVTAADELQTPDQTLPASSLFSATASDGNSIASYEVEDTTAGSGHWVFNGVAEPTNQLVFVTAAQLSELSFVTGYGSDTLMVRANDGSQWGSYTSFTVTAPPNPAPPAGTSADLIIFKPTTGDYAIYDFAHNGVPAAFLLTDIPAPWQTVGLGNFSGSGTSDMLLRNMSTGQFEIVDVNNNNASAPIVLGNVGLQVQVAGFGDFSSNPGETDMLMRDSRNGDFELYDFSNNNVPFATALGNVGLQVQVFGFGDFSGKPNETDMLMRDSNTDNVELVDFSNNAVSSVTQLGNLGSEWQFAGAGDFSGRPGETDMLARDVNTGDFELYDFQNGQVTGAFALGNVGLEIQVVGFADFSGNPNETDMLLRDTNTGNFELVDFSNNAVSAVIPLGNVGLEWQTVGTAPYHATAGVTGASDQTEGQPAASAASDPLGAGDWLTQTMQATASSAAAVAGTSSVSGSGFDASTDPIAGAAPATSLATANPLQPHTG